VSRLPGPGPRNPLAALSLMRQMVRDPQGGLVRMREEYGPVVAFGLGRLRYVYLLSPEANELILVTRARDFTWKEAFQPLVAVNGETALVVSDGEEHARRRRIVQPAFHVRRIAGYLGVMVEEGDRVVDRWAAGGTIGTVDAYAAFRLAIRRITLRCLFGGALADRESELAAHLEVSLAYVNRPPILRFDHDLPGTPYRKAMAARRAVDRLLFAEIERRRRAGEASDDVLGWLIEEQDSGAGLTDQEVRDQVVSLVAAGYDTTASAMGWAVAELAAGPEHAAAIRGELDDVTGGGPLAVEHLGRLTYAHAFVQEVLRRHSPAIWSGRKVVRDVEVHGHVVPAGTMVLFSPHVTGHLPDQFPDPGAFRPGRWVPGHPDHHDHHPYAFVPFGGGGRRCLGFAFATQELVTLTALVASRTDLALAGGALPRPAGTMSAAPAGGVRVTVRPVAPART
jgi:cytochrome P450